jgi:hypothetical protein
MRRYRKHKRDGGCFFTVDLHGDDVAALVKLARTHRPPLSRSPRGMLAGLLW